MVANVVGKLKSISRLKIYQGTDPDDYQFFPFQSELVPVVSPMLAKLTVELAFTLSE